MNNKIISFIGGILMTTFLVFGGIIMIYMSKFNKEVNYEYITSDPIYEIVDKIVTKDVYRQETPIIPVITNGTELILLDKSGSMEEFVTSLYKNNITFFTKRDVWAFDTDVYENVDINTIEFGGNTNIFQAINRAAEQGYDTIWLCSDLEHNTGEINISESAKDMNIIIYSPKPLNESKIAEGIEKLKECNTVKIITMS